MHQDVEFPGIKFHSFLGEGIDPTFSCGKGTPPPHTLSPRRLRRLARTAFNISTCHHPQFKPWFHVKIKSF